jgi:hypothetical protein
MAPGRLLGQLPASLPTTPVDSEYTSNRGSWVPLFGQVRKGGRGRRSVGVESVTDDVPRRAATGQQPRLRQKLRPCGVDAEDGPSSAQTILFCLLFFSAPASASGSWMPVVAVANVPRPSLVPAAGPSSSVPTVVVGAGCSRALTPSEAHMALYRERIRRSCALMSMPSSSGRGFFRGKRSIRARSADA